MNENQIKDAIEFSSIYLQESQKSSTNVMSWEFTNNVQWFNKGFQVSTLFQIPIVFEWGFVCYSSLLAHVFKGMLIS